MEGVFKIKKKINGANYYCYVELDALATESRELKIEYDNLLVDPEWVSSIDCAIRYFYHHFLIKENKGISVFVKKIHAMLWDTTPIVIFYTVVKCLNEALMQTLELVTLNEQNGKFEVAR